MDRTDTGTTPTPALERARRLALAGTYNLRDVGGYTTTDGRVTRWHTLLRSDSLHRLDDAGQLHLTELGVRTVIDLRHAAEIETWPNVFAGSARVRYVNLPLSDPPAAGAAAVRARSFDLEEHYRTYLDERGHLIREVIATLSEPGALPGLVHCTAGKDRTGLVTALVLAAVGVPYQTIIEDYALTSMFLDDEYRAEARRRAEQNGLDWEMYERLLGCPPEYMQRTLTYLDDRHGGIAAYLRLIGLDDGQIAALRDTLVE